MAKRIVLLFAVLTIFLAAGCSDDDPTVPSNPDLYTAEGNLHNFLVGDGTADTRLSFRMGSDLILVNHVVPNGAAIDRALLLDDPQQTSTLGFFLTGGDGTILNAGEDFPLENDKRYIFMAVGHIYTAQGQLRPTLIQLDELAVPPPGHVAFRFTHALAGSPDPVDVHVNEEVITNVAFGQDSGTVTFPAMDLVQDILIVVPTGIEPDGTNEIWKSVAAGLFLADRDYEAILAHAPTAAFNGDVDGKTVLMLHEDH